MGARPGLTCKAIMGGPATRLEDESCQKARKETKDEDGWVHDEICHKDGDEE